ncbi:heavy-metal-associated domain-containing protein [Nocardioides sp.]|jgi:copper chaperone CopZ|uniref:heavy-metal-associated domain-containing protein n=1 Tax=Nocardioides sp. TaxID=35761 RepID=UPI0019A38A41|nr:heavy-metal-associated domain-containing protein [Nocardioides sp.]MBC7277182.1 heavy-metal-associated domain-containing protein [Nocardioides sp.]
MQTIQLYVEGMRCPRCVREATARLRDLPGVATLTADRATGRITVTGEVSGTALLDALAGSSFTAEILSATTDA